MRLLRNLPIRIKIVLSTSVLCMFLLVSGVAAGLSLTGVAHDISNITLREMRRRDAVDQLVGKISKAHEELSRLVIWSADRQSPRALNKQSEKAEESLRAVNERFERLIKMIRSSKAESAPLAELRTGWDGYSRSAKAVLKLAAVDPTIGTMMLDGTDDRFRKIGKRTTDLTELVRKQATSSLQREIAKAWRMNRTEGLIAFFAIIFSVLVTWLVSGSIAKPIEDITRAMNHISVGGDDNLVGQADRRDEIGQMARAISDFQNKLAMDRTALLDQNVRLAAVISNIPHGIALYDQNAQLIIDNERHAKLYSRAGWASGCSHSEILEEKIRSSVYASPEAVLAAIADALQSEAHKEVSIDLNDGRTIAVSYSRIPGTGWVETHKDTTASRRHEAKIAHIAHHDSLTGFPNRHFFNERLSQELVSVASGKRIAIHSLDLDGFKKVNDRLGHAAGDDLLVQVAHRLRGCLRETDFCARLGGDEFVIIQSDLQSDGAPESLATAILEAIGQPYMLEFGKVAITVSDGIVVAPQHGTSFDILMRNVDAALYEAKKEPKGSFRYFDEAMNLRYQERRRLEDRLSETLDTEAFSLVYQPLFDARSLTLIGFEALCRWSDPEYGNIPPSEFIPVAEETGLIGRLGSFVLNRACRDAAMWPMPASVAVNVSPIQFRSGNFAAQIRAALSQSGLEPSRLEIEVTETALLNATEDIQMTIQEIRALGVRIVMDDFGSGYSGLSYLRSFKFDKVKIDRSFVRELPKEEYKSIVKAIVDLCRALEITTVAEGVQTHDELNFLREAGCTEVQGFLLSPALPNEEVGRFFEDKTGLPVVTAQIRVAA